MIFETAMLRPPKLLAEQIHQLRAPIRSMNREFLRRLVGKMPLRPGLDQEKATRYLESVGYILSECRELLLPERKDRHRSACRAGTGRGDAGPVPVRRAQAAGLSGGSAAAGGRTGPRRIRRGGLKDAAAGAAPLPSAGAGISHRSRGPRFPAKSLIGEDRYAEIASQSAAAGRDHGRRLRRAHPGTDLLRPVAAGLHE